MDILRPQNAQNNFGLRLRPFGKLVVVFGLAIGAISCDEQLTNPKQDIAKPDDPLERSKIVAVISCVADREKLDVTCADPNAFSAKGDPSRPNVILGKQGVYVDVLSNNAAYDNGTGDFTFDIRVRNRITQPLGTTNGSTLDPSGVRVFFNTAPYVTSGTGIVTVANADGTATFTGPAQPYFQYNEVLSEFELSPLKQWKLNMPNTVTTFAFTVLVYGAVQFPDGYIDVQPSPFTLAPGVQKTASAFVRNALGENVPGAVVTWSSSNPSVLIIDPNTGVITGVKSGTATITATSDTKVGTTTFDITGIKRVWNGSVDTDWNNVSNWDIVGLTPTAQSPSDLDTAVVPADKPRYPIFTQNNTVGGVIMQDGSAAPNINIGPFDFTLNASIDHSTTGTIGGTGRMLFVGIAQTISGGVSNVDYRNARFLGSYSLNTNLNITGGRIVVQGGRLRNALHRVRVRP